MKIKKFLGWHHFIGGVCRGCGCVKFWSTSRACAWTMTQKEWDEALAERKNIEAALGKLVGFDM